MWVCTPPLSETLYIIYYCNFPIKTSIFLHPTIHTHTQALLSKAYRRSLQLMGQTVLDQIEPNKLVNGFKHDFKTRLLIFFFSQNFPEKSHPGMRCCMWNFWGTRFFLGTLLRGLENQIYYEKPQPLYNVSPLTIFSYYPRNVKYKPWKHKVTVLLFSIVNFLYFPPKFIAAR